MGWGDAFSLADKIFGRWFSKEAVKAKRRNKIAKLEAKYEKLSKMGWSDSVARKREHVRIKLQKLKDEAINDS